MRAAARKNETTGRWSEARTVADQGNAVRTLAHINAHAEIELWTVRRAFTMTLARGPIRMPCRALAWRLENMLRHVARTGANRGQEQELWPTCVPIHREEAQPMAAVGCQRSRLPDRRGASARSAGDCAVTCTRLRCGPGIRNLGGTPLRAIHGERAKEGKAGRRPGRAALTSIFRCGRADV